MEKKLIIKGAGVLLGLYLGHVAVLTAYTNFYQPDSTLIGINLLLSLSICLAAGYYVGRRVRAQAFLHGFNVGALSAVVISSVLFALFPRDLPIGEMIIGWVLSNGFICGLGSVAGSRGGRL